MKISVINIYGAGSWGSSLASIIKDKCQVHLWGRNSEHLRKIREDQENKKYLSGISLQGVKIYSEIISMPSADAYLLAISSNNLREFLEIYQSYFDKNKIIICVIKGFEKDSGLFMSEVIEDVLGKIHSLVVLSGPTHAEEVAKNIPSAILCSSLNEKAILACQNLFMSETLRVYGHRDPKAVELGGALKNIIAIAAGIADGLGYGSNTLAALMTRGLQEMIDFAKIMNIDNRSLLGLSGIGDLITTCMSPYSRNKTYGRYLGLGKNQTEIKQMIFQTVEGIYTVENVVQCARKKDLYMPISEEVYKIIFEKKNPKTAVFSLMNRDAKYE